MRSEIGKRHIYFGLGAYLLVYHVAHTPKKLHFIPAGLAVGNTAERGTKGAHGLLDVVLFLFAFFLVYVWKRFCCVNCCRRSSCGE